MKPLLRFLPLPYLLRCAAALLLTIGFLSPNGMAEETNPASRATNVVGTWHVLLNGSPFFDLIFDSKNEVLYTCPAGTCLVGTWTFTSATNAIDFTYNGNGPNPTKNIHYTGTVTGPTMSGTYTDNIGVGPPMSGTFTGTLNAAQGTITGNVIVNENGTDEVNVVKDDLKGAHFTKNLLGNVKLAAGIAFPAGFNDTNISESTVIGVQLTNHAFTEPIHGSLGALFPGQSLNSHKLQTTTSKPGYTTVLKVVWNKKALGITYTVTSDSRDIPSAPDDSATFEQNNALINFNFALLPSYYKQHGTFAIDGTSTATLTLNTNTVTIPLVIKGKEITKEKTDTLAGITTQTTCSIKSQGKSQ